MKQFLYLLQGNKLIIQAQIIQYIYINTNTKQCTTAFCSQSLSYFLNPNLMVLVTTVQRDSFS